MDWHHAPIHRLSDAGAYMVTAGTYLKQHFFRAPEMLSFLQDRLFALAQAYGWLLEAWSFFSNHYHFIGQSNTPSSLTPMLRQLHSDTAREVNRIQTAPGRKIWFQFWDTHLTFERSYYARLNYVHSNPVHHGLVRRAADYPWCSAGWFESKADRRLVKKIYSFGTSRLNVRDPFEPIAIE